MANIFPRWVNTIPLKVIAALALTATSIIAGITYYFTPKYARVGYQPTQPVAFDHSLHVGQLGMDCRYCHTDVDKAAHSNVPSTNTCMNCHSLIKTDSPKLQPIRDSFASGEPVEWVQIHKTPDYVYFNHAAHVNRGVSCVHCHGQVNEMEVVHHEKSLSMAFCLECHREPERFIRPVEDVYNLDWSAGDSSDQKAQGEELVHDWNVNPPLSCSGCHR
ncbi:MAG: cytochrome c3 family protein [Opitutales bacterium]|nr:cytochrome c3 family protein [Opitutales bacterium]